ncbi:unnamed protein product [Ixodes pacificus]
MVPFQRRPMQRARRAYGSRQSARAAASRTRRLLCASHSRGWWTRLVAARVRVQKGLKR